jgi:hypothetical protein
MYEMRQNNDILVLHRADDSRPGIDVQITDIEIYNDNSRESNK